MNMSEPIILVCDDSEDDLVLLRRCLDGLAVRTRVVVARNGQEAVDYLARAEGADMPALALVDISMPRVDGIGVITCIRAQPRLRALPVVVLTTSNDPGDKTAAWQAGANSYLLKPMDVDGFAALLDLIVRYWLTANQGLDPQP